jgi:hypothetical protein
VSESPPLQIPTAEEVRKIHEEGVRIMSILMPYALRQMQAMYQRTLDQTHGRFIHYTTAEAACNIIRTKRFWLRNTNCMADYREVQHGFDIFNRYFLDAAKRKAFIDAFDACIPGVADDAFAIFNSWWQDLRLNTYIARVSEHQDLEDVHGRLSMWRAFGGTGTRVGIVLRFPYISMAAASLALTFGPVAYLPEPGAHGVLDEVIANVQTNRDYLRTLKRELLGQLVFQMFSSGIVCLKHEGFHEEREWRATYTPRRLFSPVIEYSTEVVAGIPQIVHKVPLDGSASPLIADVDFAQAFDRLIVGSTPYPWPIYGASHSISRAERARRSGRGRVSSDGSGHLPVHSSEEVQREETGSSAGIRQRLARAFLVKR